MGCGPFLNLILSLCICLYLFCVCVCTSVRTHLCHRMCVKVKGQGQRCGVSSLPSHRFLGIELRLSGLNSKCFCLTKLILPALIFIYLFIFETGVRYVALDSLELTMVDQDGFKHTEIHQSLFAFC